MKKRSKGSSTSLSRGRSRGKAEGLKGTRKRSLSDSSAPLKHQGHEPITSTWMNKSLFSPDKAMEVFSQTMQKLSDPNALRRPSSSRSLIDAQAFLYSSMDQFRRGSSGNPLQSSTIKTSIKDEHPFFFLLYQSYLLNMQFLRETTDRPEIVNPHIQRNLMWYIRHLEDSLSLTASVPLKRENTTLKSKTVPQQTLRPFHSPSTFKPFKLGENIATTSGKIVFQNAFFQLIQFEPLTQQVAKRPLLIVPPWLNKYYIFDLRFENSFIRWALNSGLTVFIVSWVNPDERHQEATWSDYVLSGLKTALDQACQLTKESSVNVLGYSSGGTLLSCLLGYLNAKKDKRIASATFMATPFDFSHVDELGLYRSEHKQIKREDYSSTYMVQALKLLRMNDLIWSSEVNQYLLGQAGFPFDMFYWACDALNIPPKMHETYLTEILTENRLMAPGRLSIADVPLDLSRISTPLFVMAASEDSVAPWRSVYPITQIAQTAPQKFVLSPAGHITGAFSHPRHTTSHYWVGETLPKDADQWVTLAQKKTGLWWNEWRQWLKTYEGERISARTIPSDRILGEAPGSYARANKY